MPRLLFTIAAANDGWQLYEGEHGRSRFETLNDARDSAHLWPRPCTNITASRPRW